MVRNYATPELVSAVEQGKIPVSVATGLATASKAVQRQAAVDPDRAHVLAKQELRRNREHQLAGKQLAWPTKIYGVIYADPSWPWVAYSQVTGMDRAPSYPTMTLDEIKALDVRSIAAPDSVLFLWATAPTLMQAGEVMAEWGFAYQTNFVWAKDKIATGYWNRNKHEHLLVGTRRKIPAPAPGEQLDSLLIEASVGVHSAKPAVFAEMIEQLYPNLPKIELFARGKARPGWSVWGLEAEDAA